MSNVTINKIKYQESSGKLTIEYMRTNENKKPSYHTSIFNDEPAPEFFYSIKKFNQTNIKYFRLRSIIDKTYKTLCGKFQVCRR